MTQYYRAANGIVAELFTPPAGVALAACFTADLAAEFVAVPTGKAPLPGWIVNADGTLSAPVVAPATKPQLMAYANGKLASLMATPRTYALGSGVSVKADATTATGADLLSLNVWGAANPTATQPWIDDFGVVTQVTGANAVTLANAVLAYGQSVYAILASAMTGISGGTITTTAQVDALAWPT